MAIINRQKGDALLIKTGKRLDSANAQTFHDRLDNAIDSGASAVVIDMEDLVYISSAGIRVILQALRKMEQQDARLALCSLSEGVRNVFGTSGFDQLIDIRTSKSEAIAAVEG